LKKDLYRPKQAPRAWYAIIDSYMVILGFTKSDEDPNLYYKVDDGFPLISVLYVDDLFLTGDEKLIVGCKRELTSEFKMEDLGPMHYFLNWMCGRDQMRFSLAKENIQLRSCRDLG
jgi:hypothetical protein